MSTNVTIACIGLGKHAFLLGKAASSCSNIDIHSCYSLLPEDTQRFAETFACQPQQSFHAICADHGIDGVILASPNHLHAEQCISLARSGKHVFVEKPLCNSIAETDAVIQACQDAGVQLAVGHQERREAVYRRIKRMIDQGDLGQVYAFEANHCGNLLGIWPEHDWRFDQERGTGPILHKGIHKIDILNYLFGRAHSVSTLSTRLPFNEAMDETTVTAVKYSNGIIGSLSTGFRYNNASLAVYGEHYSIQYSGFGSVISVKHEKKWTVEEIDCGNNDVFQEELSEFASAIQGQGSIEVDGNAAREAVLFAAAALESGQRHSPVRLDEMAGRLCA